MKRRVYGAAHAPAPGGRVRGLTPDSPAERAGVRAGDIVLAVDGEPLSDVLAWQWLTAEPEFTLTVMDAAGAVREVRVARAWTQPVGVEFSDVVFDGVRECDNACAFCFVAQLPKGLRPGLYVRDDDYRLSFTSGNFITLTNLTDDDVARIVGMRLSPLYVSLHAVDPTVRRALVCAADDVALERLEELLAAGIELHVQIVLVPGVNDGDVLQETLGWLSARTGVASVGVVPLGFTGHQRRFSASFGDPEAAGAVLDELEPWRQRMRAACGASWVHAADELYLAAGREVPPAAHYDGFPQYENGIGLVRSFVEEWDAALESVPVDTDRTPVDVTLVTGELFARVLRATATRAARHGVSATVLPVPNRFFGGNVSVAGLLTAADIVEAVRAHAAESERHGAVRGIYFLPDVIFNADGVTLDDIAASDLASLCGADVRVVSSDAAALMSAMLAASDESV